MLNLSKYEKHVEVASAPGQCYECGVKWPCDTSLLLAEVRGEKVRVEAPDLSKYDGHTEGPWHPDPYYPIYVWAGEAMVADMPEAGEEAYLARMRGVGRGANSFEQAANARLIADAPLLLAEVRRLDLEHKAAERELLWVRQSHARLLEALLLVGRVERRGGVPYYNTSGSLIHQDQMRELGAAVAEAEALHGE